MSRRCPACGAEYPDEVPFCGHDGAINLQVPADGAAADPRLGQQHGQHVLVARVADGAMGRVYEARHVDTKARVAIKILHDDVAGDRIAVERFKREFETAASLDSPHVVKVMEFGEVAAVPGGPQASWFLTMEYLVGTELGALLRRTGAMEPARALRVLCQVALGLDDAHSFGVIHRDLKPDNVFLCEGPEGDVVRLLDFGSVKLQMETGPKLTAFGTTLGSPVYMSPEQAMGRQDVDHRSDTFALGSILYEMLTGEVAFAGGTVAQILMRIVQEMPVPATARRASLPPSIDDVIETALAKDKKARYGGALELARAALVAFGLEAAPGRAGIEAWAARPVDAVRDAIASAVPAARAIAPIAAAASAAVSPAGTSAPSAPVAAEPALEAAASAGPNRLVLGVAAAIAVALALGAFFVIGR